VAINSSDSLIAASPRRETGTRIVTIGNAQTRLGDWTISSRRYCPECFAQDRVMASGREAKWSAWHRNHWDVLSITTCTEHQRQLVTGCPVCGSALGWSKVPLDRCACGADLVAYPDNERQQVKLDAVFTDMVTGAQTMLPRLQGKLMSHASAYYTYLGGIKLGWRESLPPRGAMAWLQRDAGFAIDSAGDKAITARLDMILQGRPAPTNGRNLGLMAAYGWVWRSWLGVPIANPMVTELRAKLLEHAEANGVIAKGERSRVGMTLGEARQALGSGHNRTRRLMAAEHLLAPQARRGVAMTIDAERVRELAIHRGHLVDARTAANLLGIARGQFRALAAAGIVAADKRMMELDGVKLYDPDALATMISSLTEKLPRLLSLSARCARLPDACRDESASLVAALRAIGNGTLFPVATVPGTGLRMLVVVTQELRHLRTARLTVMEAARQLDLHPEAARWLAKRGLFRSGDAVVDQSAVDGFRAKFCTAAQIGLALGITGRQASANMRTQNIIPVFGPPGCRQSIYRHSDAALIVKH